MLNAVVQAFADILASNETFAAPMEDTYKLLDLNPEDTTTLEQYLQARAPSSQQGGSAWALVVASHDQHERPHHPRQEGQSHSRPASKI